MLQKSRFEISKQTHGSQYSMHSAHAHSYHELYYLMDGECNFFFKNNTYRMRPGALLIIPSDTLHKTTYLEQQEHERLYIEFTPDYLSDVIASLGNDYLDYNFYGHFFFAPPDKRCEINGFLKQIIQNKSKNDPFSSCLVKLQFEELILCLLRNFPIATNKPSDIPISIVDKNIQKAMLYIEEHFTSPLSLSDVADYLHLNYSYFSKRFKEVNGFGFKEYINNMRINYSEKLLLETDRSITTIAFECGFDNSNYFGDAFKSVNGISPSQFRRIKGNVQ